MNFDYSDQIISKLKRSISEERLEKYLEQSRGKLDGALLLYVRNTAISEAFYTPLQGLEVAVRNSIHAQLRNKLGTPEWYDCPNLRMESPLPDMIAAAKKDLRDDNKPVTPGAMVAALRFGFWVSILAPRYEDHWRSHLRNAFPFRPRALERKQVHGALNKLRRLRNRVAHHEPILHRDLEEDHAKVLEVLSWICPDTASWVEAHSRFNKIF